MVNDGETFFHCSAPGAGSWNIMKIADGAVPLMTKHTLEGIAIISALLCATGLGITNGIYAIRRPANFLRARWTFRRGFGPQTPLKDVRSFGVVTAICFAYGFVIGCKLLIQVIRGS